MTQTTVLSSRKVLFQIVSYCKLAYKVKLFAGTSYYRFMLHNDCSAVASPILLSSRVSIHAACHLRGMEGLLALPLKLCGFWSDPKPCNCSRRRSWAGRGCLSTPCCISLFLLLGLRPLLLSLTGDKQQSVDLSYDAKLQVSWTPVMHLQAYSIVQSFIACTPSCRG